VLEGTHDGFIRLPGRPYPARRFTVTPDAQNIVIEDRIENGRGQTATARFLFHPDCVLLIECERARIPRAIKPTRLTNDIAILRLSHPSASPLIRSAPVGTLRMRTHAIISRRHYPQSESPSLRIAREIGEHRLRPRIVFFSSTIARDLVISFS
jgi:hypothetical protein